MIRTLALVRLRLDTPLLGLNAVGIGAVQQHAHGRLVHLPEEIWALVWGCLRSADFGL